MMNVIIEATQAVNFDSDILATLECMEAEELAHRWLFEGFSS
jgi:hypothetical protein